MWCRKARSSSWRRRTADRRRRSSSRGALIGELALLTETKRPVTAVAREPSSVVRIPRQLFLKTLEGYPDAARAHARRARGARQPHHGRIRPGALGAGAALRCASESPFAIEAALRRLAPKIPPHEFGAVVDHALDSAGLKSAVARDRRLAVARRLCASRLHRVRRLADAGVRSRQRAPLRCRRDGGDAAPMGCAAPRSAQMIDRPASLPCAVARRTPLRTAGSRMAPSCAVNGDRARRQVGARWGSIMFATPFTAFHTLAEPRGDRHRRLRDVDADEEPAARYLDARLSRHHDRDRRHRLHVSVHQAAAVALTAILSLVLIALALLAHYVFHFAGAWRWIYAVSMGLAVYLNFFVLVTQLFLKVPALHALAPNAPDNPEPPFLIAQLVVLAIFVWLIWKSVKNFRGAAAVVAPHASLRAAAVLASPVFGVPVGSISSMCTSSRATGTMLDALRHDEHLAGPERDGAVAHLDVELRLSGPGRSRRSRRACARRTRPAPSPPSRRSR